MRFYYASKVVKCCFSLDMFYSNGLKPICTMPIAMNAMHQAHKEKKKIFSERFPVKHKTKEKPLLTVKSQQGPSFLYYRD
ncbi:hypothetical protein [Mitsuokella jalaludinii]|uniref:hypothetical protein n=1 Tax=Mitsuokella jalaludinii TaxID=187979 RepID=UPI003F9D5C11